MVQKSSNLLLQFVKLTQEIKEKENLNLKTSAGELTNDVDSSNVELFAAVLCLASWNDKCMADGAVFPALPILPKLMKV